jgi:hypothetical protein
MQEEIKHPGRSKARKLDVNLKPASEYKEEV